jgi:ABC-2 type transport system permease protein
MTVLGNGFQLPGLWSSVWKLLRLQVVISINNFKRAKIRKKIGTIVVLIFLLLFLGFVLFASIALLSFLRSPELMTAAGIGDFSALLDTFPTLLLTASTVGILLTSFSVLLQGLYLAGDMDFLMSVPIPIRAVFVAKLVQAVLPNFLLSSLFILPVLFGLGISAGYNLLYYPLVLIVLVALALAAAGLSSLLVLVAARFFPARRLAEVLGFVIGTFFFIFSQSARFMRFEEQQVTSMINLAARAAPAWNPLTWVGQGLIFVGEGRWLAGLSLVLVCLALTGGIFYLALTTSERLYYSGWSSLQNNRRAKARSVTKPVETIRRQNPLAGLLPGPVRAILVKDWRVYRRDLRNASQLLTPLILGVVYAVGFLRSGGQAPAGQGEAPAFFMKALENIFVYGDVALALFLGWMLVANLGGLGFSHEGKNYWMIKTAPLTARTLLAAKFLVAFIPSFAVCGVYLLVLQILKSTSLWSILFSLVLLALSLAGLTGIYLFFGVTGAKFDWDNPQKMGGTVGCWGSLLGMIFLGIAFTFYAGPAIAFTLFGLPSIAGQAIGLVLGGGISLAAWLIPLRLVESKVERLNEA